MPTLSLRDIWQDLESPVALEPRASARSATRPPRTDNRDPRLVVWNLATGAVELDVPRPVGFNTEHAAVSSDGSLVVCAAHRTQCVLRGHTHRAWCVDVSPDGTWAVSCDDETVRGWDLREAREIVRLEFGVLGVVLRCAVLASGRVLSFMVVLAMSRSCLRCDNPLVPGATRCGKCGMVLAAPRGDPHVGRTVGNLKLVVRREAVACSPHRPLPNVRGEAVLLRTRSSTMLEKVISGGQRGADRAGLEAARALGLATGGIAPRGWRVRLPDGEDVADPDLADFGLVPHTSSSYPARTRLNVEQSDGTVWFGYALAPGGKLTIGHCKKIGRPCIVNPSPEQLAAWVEANGIKTLNVAGNRESAFNPDISLRVFQTLVKAFGSAEQIAALV